MLPLRPGKPVGGCRGLSSPLLLYRGPPKEDERKEPVPDLGRSFSLCLTLCGWCCEPGLGPASPEGAQQVSVKPQATPTAAHLAQSSCRGRSCGAQGFPFPPQLVAKEDPTALAATLSWDREKTEALQRACERELALRLQQVHSLRALRKVSTRKNLLPEEPSAGSKRARPDPT